MVEDSGLLKDLKEYFECPVCYNIPRKPPIYQCDNGHMICASCKPRIKCCPQCRKPFRGRLLFAERLLDKVPVPCRYQQEGCDLEILVQYIETHERSCPYGPVPCTYKEYGCNEIVPRREMSKHLETCSCSPVSCQVVGCNKKIGQSLYLRHIRDQHTRAFDLSSTNSILLIFLVISMIANFIMMT